MQTLKIILRICAIAAGVLIGIALTIRPACTELEINNPNNTKCKISETTAINELETQHNDEQINKNILNQNNNETNSYEETISIDENDKAKENEQTRESVNKNNSDNLSETQSQDTDVESKTENENESIGQQEDSSSNESNSGTDVQFQSVNEVVYISASTLNLRTGPSTKYDIVKTMPRNTELKRVGIGNNGWSQVIWDDNVVYAYSSYLSDKPTEIPSNNVGNKNETVEEEILRRGNICRLTIPDVGTNVAVFKYNGSKTTQAICDERDSAVMLSDGHNFGEQTLIADHVNQGFDTIKLAIPNSTIAYLDYGKYIDSYICVGKVIGINNGKDLVYPDGTTVYADNPGNLIMYTCNSDGTITITFWQLS